MPKKFWFDVFGFEGIYEITRSGMIRSVRRYITYKDGRSGYWTDGQRLHPSLSNTGYYYVNLRKDGRLYPRRVHRMLLETFVEPRPVGFECRHLDGNKTNNKLENLKWGTPKENSEDMVRHGTSNKGKTFLYKRGEENPFSRFKNGEVWLIKKILSKTSLPQHRIAKMFKTNQTQISQIKRKQIWGHINYV